MYSRYLRKAKHLVGNSITDTLDLNIAGRKLFGDKFVGAFPSDEIPDLSPQHPYAIMNLDNSSQPGSHWIAIRYIAKNEIEFFDSFNRLPLKIMPVLKQYRIIRDPATGSEKQLIREQNCGARSLAKIIEWNK